MSYLDEYLEDFCTADYYSEYWNCGEALSTVHSPGPSFVGPHYQLMGPPEDIPF
jgi:hypothetical protein